MDLNVKHLQVGHGYTIADVDGMTRTAFKMARTVRDAEISYQIAWSAIALAIVEAEERPASRDLVNAGWQAIYDEVTESRRAAGIVGTSGAQVARFWHTPNFAFEDNLIDRLAVIPICLTLTPEQLDVLRALAIHGEHETAAHALSISRSSFQRRLADARAAFYGQWFAPEPIPAVRVPARRTVSDATHCSNDHEWTPENTGQRRRWKGGAYATERVCKACQRASAARSYAARKDAA